MRNGKIKQITLGLGLLCCSLVSSISSASIDGSGVINSKDSSGVVSVAGVSARPLSIDGSGIPVLISTEWSQMSIDGSGLPRSIDGSGIPMSIDGSGTPKSIDGSGIPMSIDGSGTPKSIDGSGIPMSIDGSGTPKSIDGSGIPMSIDGSGTPKSIDGSGIPMSIDGSGTPKSIDGSGIPMSIDGSGIPMSIDGSGMPMSIDGSGRPTLAMGPIYRLESNVYSVLGYQFVVSIQLQEKMNLVDGEFVLLSVSTGPKEPGVANGFLKRINEPYSRGISPVYLFGAVTKANPRIGSFVVNSNKVDYLSLMSDPESKLLTRGEFVGVLGIYPQAGMEIIATRIFIF